jgi:hypothetical protein
VGQQEEGGNMRKRELFLDGDLWIYSFNQHGQHYSGTLGRGLSEYKARKALRRKKLEILVDWMAEQTYTARKRYEESKREGE